MKFYLSVLWGASAVALTSAQVAVYEGPANGPGDVLVLDETSSTPLLQGIRFLPLEISGRTRLDVLASDRAQLREDIPGASRVVLPGAQGSLYRYQTVRTQGAVFGLMVVERSGNARVVAEFAGWGPAGVADPLSGFVAVDPAGTTLWTTSVQEVGGDLFEIDMLTGSTINRTGQLGPVAFLDRGLALHPTFGIAMTEMGPLRLDRNNGPAQLFPFAGVPPVWFAADLVASEDRRTFAFIAGPSELETHVYYGRAGGLAKRVSETATGLTRVGFAYDTLNGPWLGLSSDGSLCAWISQGDSRELFVRELETMETNSEFQVTHDQRFSDTLNDSGVIAFLSADSLVALVGDDSGSEIQKIEQGDFYRVDFEAGAVPDASGEPTPTILNLSGTSGDSSLPYVEYGTMSSEAGVYRVPGFGLLALNESCGCVAAMAWNGTITPLVDNVETINDIYLVGDDVILDVLLGAPGEVEERSALYRLGPQLEVVSLLAELPAGGRFTRPAMFEGGYFAAIATLPQMDGWLGRIEMPFERTSLLSTTPLLYGPTQGFGADGALTFTVELGALTYFVSWTPTGLRLLSTKFSGFVLPSR